MENAISADKIPSLEVVAEAVDSNSCQYKFYYYYQTFQRAIFISIRI
jgi:hypothetical protein